MKIVFVLCILVTPLVAACTTMNPQADGTLPIDHKAFDVILKKYVTNEGLVDYLGILKEKETLQQYLDKLQENGPNEQNWSKDEQLTFWINAYNAFTIRLILDYYPVESIKDIGSKIQVPFVNTPWDIKFIKIADQELSLNNIEHNIIRKNFEEPRIHFALVCAAISCPKLRNEAYTPDRLEEQLSDQATSFLSDNTKNNISESDMELSKIFNWYGGDFTKKMTLIEYLNQYAPVKINKKANKSFMDYNWSLNKQ